MSDDASSLRQVDITSLTTREPFATLFAIKPEVLAGVIASMQERGFDPATPIVTWNLTVIEGHTRKLAAEQAGLSHVWVAAREFASDDDALAYAIRAQANRRNLEPKELLACVAQLDRIKRAGRPEKLASRDADSLGKSAAETATQLGVSQSTVERVRAVNADDEAVAAVAAGTSINAAYTQVQEKKRQARRAAPPKQAKLVIPLPASAVDGVYTVTEWKALTKRDREYLLREYPGQVKADYNRTNENIEWASWSWNPVTGCLHDCPYCYARDSANRFYEQKFMPAFLPWSAPCTTEQTGSRCRRDEPR